MGLFAFEVLERPATYSCGETLPREIGEQRVDYWLVAVPLTSALILWLAVCSWRWAAERMEGRTGIRRPGRLVLTLAPALGALWAVILVGAFVGEEVGGYSFLGALLAIPGAVVAAGSVVALLIRLPFNRVPRKKWLSQTPSPTVSLAWSLLLSVAPYMLVMVVVSGKDTTLFC